MREVRTWRIRVSDPSPLRDGACAILRDPALSAICLLSPRYSYRVLIGGGQRGHWKTHLVGRGTARSQSEETERWSY